MKEKTEILTKNFEYQSWEREQLYFPLGKTNEFIWIFLQFIN